MPAVLDEALDETSKTNYSLGSYEKRAVSISSTSTSTSPAALFEVLRPKQWTKNLVAFAPLIFAGKASDPTLFQNATLCVIAFCMLSSSNHILNDIVDRHKDRLHSEKRKRPIAAGRVSIPQASIVAVILAVGAMLLAFFVRPALSLVLLAYLALGAAYTLKLKQFAIIDVFVIASGFLLRAVAGAVAIHVAASSWFLLCTGLGALYLGLEKRRHELVNLEADPAESHRPALGQYSIKLLDRLESLVLPALLTSYVFYSFLSVHGQWMMITVPFVIYGLMRYQQLSDKQDRNTGAPEEVLLKDRAIQITLVFWLATSALVVYGKIPQAVQYLVAQLDALSMMAPH